MLDRKYADCAVEARCYKSEGRALAAARKMFGKDCWWRVVYVGCGDYVIDTFAGFVC
jgi:hypothetical protein